MTFSKQLSFLLSLVWLLSSQLNAQNSSSYSDNNNIKNFNQSIPLGKANVVKALINVNGGELVVNSETNELTEVDFNYYDNYWTPSVSYTETADEGKLVVKTNANFKESNVKDKNACKITLNPSVNYSLGLELGAGVADLNLSGFKISKALLRLGVGSFNVDFSNTSIPLLKVEAGIGEAIIDLSGERSVDLNANISAGIGEMTIYVPSDVGVQFKISGFLGEISAPQFRKDGKVYTNKLFGESDIKMEFDVSGAIGSIKVIQR